jgi:hypothetical protein
MDNTPNLALPLLANKQALQTTFHDEALKTLDALVMLSVIDRDLSSPPASPDDGDRYLVKAPGSGDPAWLGNRVVVYLEGHWIAHSPRPGWTCYVEDEGALIAWDGTAWQPALDVLGGGVANNLALLGVGTTADAANPFSAKLNNALWTARTVAEGGDGHLRAKLSKESAAKTLSLLFQDNLSGRAEIGLTGDDDLHFKVSADGSAWTDALVLDRATGGVRFLVDETSVASAATCDIGAAAGLKVAVTGTATIASLGTQPHRIKFVRFAGALTLTHHATSLILPGGANIVTAAGDAAIFASDASGNWRCWGYQRGAQAPDGAAKPAVSAHKGGVDQTGVTQAAYSKITFGTEDWDVGGHFASSTWTPPAGRYEINCNLYFTTANAVDGEQLGCSIYKNGAEYKATYVSRAGTVAISAAVNCIVDADGDDVFEVYAWGGSTNPKTILGNPAYTYFQTRAI